MEFGTPRVKAVPFIAALLVAMAVPTWTYATLITCNDGSQSISSPLEESSPPVVIAGGTCDLLVTSSITGNGSGTDDPALLGHEEANITLDGGVVVAKGSGMGGSIPRAGIRLLDNAAFTFFSGEVRGAGSGMELDRAGILAEGSSRVTMLGGAANALGSAIDSSRTGVLAQDAATVSIFGGTIGVTSGNSSIGTIGHHIASRDNATVYIFGEDFNFPPGPIAPLDGTLTGFLQDGEAVNWLFTRDEDAQIYLGTGAGCSDPPGDVTTNGSTNILDVQCVILTVLSEIAGSPSPTCLAEEVLSADLNCDGTVNVIDALVAVHMALELPFGEGAYMSLGMNFDANLDSDQDGCPDACGD